MELLRKLFEAPEIWTHGARNSVLNVGDRVRFVTGNQQDKWYTVSKTRVEKIGRYSTVRFNVQQRGLDLGEFYLTDQFEVERG